MTRTELADAMLKGLSNPEVRENAFRYIGINDFDNILEKKPCMACAIGCALIGKHNGDYVSARDAYDATRAKEEFEWEDDLEIFARLLEIPFELAQEIEYRHLDDEPITQIAAWLKSSEMEVSANV